MAEQESRLAIVIDTAGAEARIRRLREQLRELGQQTDDTSRNTDDLGRRADRASRDTNRLSAAASTGKSALASMAKAASILGAAVGGIGAAAILATADSMQILNNQIRVATDGAGEYAIAQSEIERIAMSTFSSLESVGQMYASNERALSSLGKSQSEVLLFTENISKAMSVSGGSAESQAAALTQLGQAMASGVLRGDEFNSIAEQAPVIMDLLTESLGVTRGELRAMAADGALTAEIVYDAVSGASSTLDGMMGQTVTTMSQAMTNIKTQWALLADGLVNGEGGIGDGLASSIQKVALALQDARVLLDEFLNRAETIAFVEGVVDNIIALWDQLSAGIDAAYNAISEFVNSAGFITAVEMAAEGLKNVWDNLVSVIEKTAEVIAPVIDFFREHDKLSEALAISIGLVGGAFIIYNAAVIVGTAATAAFTAVLAFVTAPITLIVLAMVALVAAGVYVYQNWEMLVGMANDFADTLVNGVISAFNSSVDAANNFADGIVNAVVGGFNSAVDAVSSALAAIKGFFSSNFPAMTAIVSSSIEIIKTLFVGGFNLIKNTVSTVLGVIKAVISGDFKAIPGIIGNGLKSAASIVGSMMTNILNIIKNAGKQLYSIGRDFIQGFINGIKSVGSGVASAASTMVGNAIEAVRKRQDSASPSKVTTKLGGDFSQGMAVGIKQGAKTVKSEAQKMAEGAIEAVQTGIDRIKKELALFGNNSNLADLEYDIKIGKYNGASDAKKTEYRNYVAELDAMNAAAKFRNELASKAKKAADALRERTVKAGGNFIDLQRNQEGLRDSPVGRIMEDYENKLSAIREYEATHQEILAESADKRLEVERAYNQARAAMMVDSGEVIFGSISSMAKDALGEQSGVYRAMFAVEKGFAIARSIMAIQTAMASATASLPFPANLPVIAQVAAQGAQIISNIKAVAGAGFKQGGYTGNMGASQVAGVVHGQEYVFDAQSTKRIGVDNLNAMRRGENPKGGGDVIINNYSSAKIEQRQDANGVTILDVRDEIKRSWTNTGNPNSFESKQLNRNIQAPRRR